ncbi:diacylglycerol/lipid kinase family protein [Gardnerella sp. KA00747]|uniref:diacylglycerol/lipid kinase family protein n=1 Tax=Gardnerella sp. KA00747 TaxID=2749078 RepID=UPI003BADA730
MPTMPIQATIALMVIVFALVLAPFVIMIVTRALKRHHLAEKLAKRHGDAVHYAFILNPSKPQAETYREYITNYCNQRKFTYEIIDTQLDKDGRACALEALSNGANVVVAVGGDGTVRTVASAVSGQGHAMGIIPIGTGNLFARNMGIPVNDVEAALRVATSHGSRQVDVGRVTILDRPNEDHGHAFLIISGIGFDALMIDDTNPRLKKNLSWLAYFIAGVKHLFIPKYRATVTIQRINGNESVLKGLTFRTLMAGNCGQIPMFSLMPEAAYDDGVLDFEIIDTSVGLIGWANLFRGVVHQTLTGRALQQETLSAGSRIDQTQGFWAEVRLEKPAPVQVDGDILGYTKHLRFSVDKQALCVRVPASAKTSVAVGE